MEMPSRPGQGTGIGAVRTLPAELWSGRPRRYAVPKISSSVKVSAPKGALRSVRDFAQKEWPLREGAEGKTSAGGQSA